MQDYDEIKTIIYQQTGVDIGKNLNNRKQYYCKLRQLAMYCLKLKNKYSIKAICLRFQNKDNNTVVHACKVVENILETRDKTYYPVFSRVIDKVEKDELLFNNIAQL